MDVIKNLRHKILHLPSERYEQKTHFCSEAGKRSSEQDTRSDSTSSGKRKSIFYDNRDCFELLPTTPTPPPPLGVNFSVCNLTTLRLLPCFLHFINGRLRPSIDGLLQTSVADFIIESIYDLQGKVSEERVNSPIKNLRKRFDDVCSWTSYIVLSQLLPDERRAAFGCLLRVAITCWNIGNFIGAKEIITGLR